MATASFPKLSSHTYLQMKLVQKHLGDDFEFVAIVAQAVVGTDTFQVVDQRFGLLGELLRVVRLACFIP